MLATLAEREPNLFQRGGTLVQVVPGDDGRPFHRPAEGPGALQFQEARLRELVATHCELLRPKSSRSGVELAPVHPPLWVVRALLDRFRWPDLPRLEGVVSGPVLRADGTVLQTPGYDPESRLFYAPGQDFEAVPERPSSAESEAALDRLRRAVCDFPFQTEAHFVGWLASLLTPGAFRLQGSPSPLNLVDANVRGDDKSLLADVCHLIVTDRPAPRMAYLRDESELRKAITTIALKARQMVLIDNVRGAFGSPTLDLALTSTIWEDRLLGQNVEVELPLLVTWYVTGNNIDLKGDLGRRCVHIRLESPEEKPEHRGGFRHPRLLDWLEKERRHLLPAALTLLAGFRADPSPAPALVPWGSYESWSDLVRTIVVWLGLPDPAETAEGLTAFADAEGLAAHNLVEGLEELLQAPSTAAEILRDLDLARQGERCGELLASVEELFPRLRPGELPTTVFDAIFLDYFHHQGWLAAIRPGEVEDPGDFVPYALEGSRVDGALYGLPQFGCSDILFFRRDDQELAQADTLDVVRSALGECTYSEEIPPPGVGLMVDFSGGTTSACRYLDAVQEIYGVYTDDPPLPPGDDKIDPPGRSTTSRPSCGWRAWPTPVMRAMPTSAAHGSGRVMDARRSASPSRCRRWARKAAKRWSSS